MSNKKIQVADWYDKHWDHWLNTKEKISPKEIDGLFPKEFKFFFYQVEQLFLTFF